MFPQICYSISQVVSDEWKFQICVRGKVGKMSFWQNDCTGKKTFWKARVGVLRDAGNPRLSASDCIREEVGLQALG